MSFNNRLFSVDDFAPRRKNGKRKNGKNGARRERSQFAAPGFFGGLRGVGDVGVATRGGIGEGLQVPELGEGFNTRFGKIGTGFVENVNTFKVGFQDVTTGNGRTGEIIGRGFGRAPSTRGRGRPRKRKSAVSSLLSGGRKKGGKGIKIGKAVIGGKEGKTVAQLIGGKVIEKTDTKFREGVGKLKRRAEGIPEGFERETIELGAGEGRGRIVTQEGEGISFRETPEEGGVTFAGRAEEDEVEAIEDAVNGDTGEGVGEPLVDEEEEILDEDLEEDEFGTDDDDIEDPFPRTRGGFIR